jgi:hypothetical protein
MMTTRVTTETSTSALTISSPSLKKTKKNTTSRLHSVITRLTLITETKEKATPRCQRSHSPQVINVRKINLPFSDLCHRLINGVGSQRRVDCSQEREKRRRAQSVERSGRRTERILHGPAGQNRQLYPSGRGHPENGPEFGHGSATGEDQSRSGSVHRNSRNN